MATLNNDGVPGLFEFLQSYPGMSVAPKRRDDITLKGTFEFTVNIKDDIEITDSYDLKIEVPKNFPSVLPRVFETAGKIPRSDDFHLNGNGSLCLGAPLKVLQALHRKPDLVGYAENCLIYYLYSISYKMKYGKLPFGELAHKSAGLVQEYSQIFNLKSAGQVVRAIYLISLKRRLANKKTCPCRCGKRLGKCSLRRKINSFRMIAPRSWFKAHLADLKP